MHTLFPVILFLIVPNLAFAPLARPAADLAIAGDPTVTNGERLARGLPLLKPKWRDPTRVRRSYQSPSPKVIPAPPTPQWCRGRIIPVLAKDNTKLGYLGTSFSEKGSIQIIQDASSAMLVRFRPCSHSSMEEMIPLEILNGHKGLLAVVATNGNEFNFPSTDLGILGSSLDSSGKSNSYSEATSVQATVETNIWKFEPRTSRLTARWLGEDKLSHPLEFLLTGLRDVDIAALPHDTEALPGTQKIRFIFEAETA